MTLAEEQATLWEPTLRTWRLSPAQRQSVSAVIGYAADLAEHRGEDDTPLRVLSAHVYYGEIGRLS